MPTCSKCGGTGLIPFVNKAGKVIPFAWQDCDCKVEPVEHHEPITPADFDFSVSDTFRGYYHQHYGGHDRGYKPTIERKSEVVRTEVIHRTSNMSAKDFARLNSIEGEVKYLRQKLEERQQQARKPIKKQTGYKGLSI